MSRITQLFSVFLALFRYLIFPCVLAQTAPNILCLSAP
jgi:hypothetical protein